MTGVGFTRVFRGTFIAILGHILLHNLLITNIPDYLPYREGYIDKKLCTFGITHLSMIMDITSQGLHCLWYSPFYVLAKPMTAGPGIRIPGIILSLWVYLLLLYSTYRLNI